MKNNSYAKVAKDFGISQRTVGRISSSKDNLVKAFESNGNKNRKRKRESTTADVDDALYRWFSAHRNKKDTPIGGPECCLKAEEFAKKLNVENFEPHAGWLHRWKKRHGISFSVKHGETAQAERCQTNQNF